MRCRRQKSRRNRHDVTRAVDAGTTFDIHRSARLRLCLVELATARAVTCSSTGEIVTAQTDVSRALTRHLRDVIEQLESGKLTDQQATRDLLAAGVKAANQAAWLPVKERDAAAFADGWTPQKQIQRLKLMLGD